MIWSTLILLSDGGKASAAAEEIGRLLPLGDVFVAAYRSLPGQWVGDRVYEQLRDNRYSWFGKRSSIYQTAYSADCGCTKLTLIKQLIEQLKRYFYRTVLTFRLPLVLVRRLHIASPPQLRVCSPRWSNPATSTPMHRVPRCLRVLVKPNLNQDTAALKGFVGSESRYQWNLIN